MKTKILPMFAILAIIMMVSPVAAFDWREAAKAKVRVIHASPDAPNVDVWVEGAPAFQNVAFEQVTDYAALKRGTYNVQVVPAGATEPVVIDADLKLRAARFYSVYAVNTLDSIEPIVVQDRNWQVGKKAKIRFVHASPDAPAVDIALKNGPVLFGDVEFKDASSYIRVAPGTYDLEVRLAGTDTVVLPLDGIELSGRTVYTAIATGLVGEGSLNAVLSVDRSMNKPSYDMDDDEEDEEDDE
jgi:hypothetical protein